MGEEECDTELDDDEESKIQASSLDDVPLGSNCEISSEEAGRCLAEPAVTAVPSGTDHTACARVSSVAGGQVANFHSSSRLHFLGTWRERVVQWQEAWRTTDSTTNSLLDPIVHSQLRKRLEVVESGEADTTLHWAHLDMDCFFASLIERDMHESAKVPLAVVTSLSAGGELCSCNYAARAHGVNTHLWSVQRAREALPSIKLIPMSEALLRSAERAFHQVYLLMLVACGGDTERVHVRSCDEAFLMLHNVESYTWAQALQQAVYAQTKCSCSIGVGSSQILSKLACKASKPNGIRVIPVDQLKPFLAHVPLSALPQVGRALAAKLDERKLMYCKDVWALQKRNLQQWFGSKGEMLWAWSHGEDASDVLQSAERKSMSSDINFGVRPSKKQDVLKLISEVARQLSERLRASSLVASQLTLKLKIAVAGWTEPVKKGGHGACDDISRSGAVLSPTSEESALSNQAARLLDALVPDPQRVRGVGLAAKVTSARVGSKGTLDKFLRPSGAVSAGDASQAGAPPYGRSGFDRNKLVDRSRSPSFRRDPGIEHSPEVLDASPQSLQPTEHGRSSRAAAVIIDCDSSSDEEPQRGSEVACPVCGVLLAPTLIEVHVNSHFDDVRR